MRSHRVLLTRLWRSAPASVKISRTAAGISTTGAPTYASETADLTRSKCPEMKPSTPALAVRGEGEVLWVGYGRHGIVAPFRQ